VLFGLLLAGSLCVEVKLPIVGVGMSNLVVPASAIAMIALLRRGLADLWLRQRGPVTALLAFSAWALVASLLGEMPRASAYYWVKFNLLGLAMPAFLLLVADDRRRWSATRLAHGFLLGLAALGVVEAFFPESALFVLFRTDGSLSISPRVASLLGWPNQFGVLMAVGVVLTEQLRRRELVGPRLGWICLVVFLTQAAQSGSRNSWLTLLGALVWMAARRMMPARRAAGLGALFVAIVLILPVSARQTGLWDHSWSPGRFDDQPWTPSLSSPGLSLSLRTQLWREAVHEIREHPVAGLGLEVFEIEVGPRVMGRRGYNAHNLALNIAAELGLVGLALALVVGVQLVRTRSPDTDLAEAALVTMLGGQVLDCFVHDPTFMGVLYFFAAAFVWQGRDP
jgi:O-antigen ligase